MGDIMKQSKMHLTSLPTTYVVVDTETTGLDPETCELVEVSALKVVDLAPIDSYSTFVACDHLNADAARVNGITAKMLEGAPSPQEAIDGLVEFCGDLPLMAHNAKFDRGFIERVRPIKNEWVDTMQLASAVVHGKRTLSALCDRYGIENEDAHRALSDCMATHKCYLKMREELAQTSMDARDIIANRSVADPSHPLYGKTVVFSGDTNPSSRHLAMQAVADIGGTPANGVTLKTDYLVTLAEYEEPTGKVRKATEYAGRDGCPIKIISKDEFCGLLGGDAGAIIASRHSDDEKLDLSTRDGWRRANDSSAQAEEGTDNHVTLGNVRKFPVARSIVAAALVLMSAVGLSKFQPNVAWLITEAIFAVPAILLVRSVVTKMKR